jgi:hypothetical protein
VAYFYNRGLDSLAYIGTKYRDRKWLLPDLICDEVIDLLNIPDNRIRYYHVNENFYFGYPHIPYDAVFYSVDYFGLEQPKVNAAIVIRDGVWFPYPQRHLEPNEIWFNSFRKIIRGATGSLLLGIKPDSPLETGPIRLTDKEQGRRHLNYGITKELLNKYSISYEPTHPTLFPIRLQNRDDVISKLKKDHNIDLPGKWKNKYNLPNKLYNELTFLPLDSRFTVSDIISRCEKINKYAIEPASDDTTGAGGIRITAGYCCN